LVTASAAWLNAAGLIWLLANGARSAICLPALHAGEAMAEWLHGQARRAWGYGADERLTHADLLAERYRGIRPAFGYPACPDHRPKLALFDLLAQLRPWLNP